ARSRTSGLRPVPRAGARRVRPRQRTRLTHRKGSRPAAPAGPATAVHHTVSSCPPGTSRTGQPRARAGGPAVLTARTQPPSWSHRPELLHTGETCPGERATPDVAQAPPGRSRTTTWNFAPANVRQP